MRLVDCCTREIFHASGAFENKKGNGTSDAEAVALFLSSMAPVIEILANAGVGPAAHRLLETLEYLMPCGASLPMPPRWSRQ